MNNDNDSVNQQDSSKKWCLDMKCEKTNFEEMITTDIMMTIELRLEELGMILLSIKGIIIISLKRKKRTAKEVGR